jgi:antitoxin MazE
VVRTGGVNCTYMAKTLTRTGNSLAIVLDKPILEATGIDADTPLEVSTDGDVIVISPIRPKKRTAKLKKILEELDREHAGAFKRLAE